MLHRHSHAGDVAGINAAGVRIAREAFGDRDGYVIGDIGPFGGWMEPYGDFTAAAGVKLSVENGAILIAPSPESENGATP
jgi:5-methyltetrahydrofolate--homocysteine methyltransferase